MKYFLRHPLENTTVKMRPPTASYLPSSRIQRVLSPFAHFIRTESAGGLVLIGCTLVALAWANSGLAASYHELWEIEAGFRVGSRTFEMSVHHWINDGLMSVFFFLVGLEIKREALVGELASVRKAALPIAAAIGGMLVPAALYALFNAGGPGAAGWGVPMATDIAFALGVLALLGPTVPIALKVFLTAFAIVDDIGAVLVIGIFYTERIVWGALGLGFLLLATCLLMNRLGVRRPLVYLLLGAAVWGCFLASGVHATLAGVLVAMTIPGRTRIDGQEYIKHGERALSEFKASSSARLPTMTNPGQQAALHELEELSEAAQAPLQRIEHNLQPFVAFAILPLFALANAGVSLTSGIAESAANPIALGIIIGLVLGKPLGITLMSLLVVRLRLADLPTDVTWQRLHAVSWLGGIGFTMSLFIAGLAFPTPASLDVAKVGVFGASLLAGILGLALVRWSCRGYVEPRRRHDD